jgi:eukaryotic-like serine/threonine-protein kinase
MTQEQWKLAWSLICEVQDLPSAHQDAILSASNAPEAVLEHVRGVLASNEEPEADLPVSLAPANEETVGPYRIVKLLGEGSMGTVYLAQQEKPLQRAVALKIIRPGLRSREVLERFEIERRVLALMDHASIARVYEAGVTQVGNPYFAMEYVPGVSITAYCSERNLLVRQRLELLISACEAIQHAHQKGIIHRDLKPSNVLVAQVDRRPLLKIIDFGVARATRDSGVDTLATQFGSVVGTIAYMSPEQAAYDTRQIDTRSDVYSLGVLAYQLLTGTTPIEDAAIRTSLSNMPALLERVRIEEPDPPSRRAPASGKELVGELDWIVMKALEKDPARRYQTANGFALDLQRYLQGEPVEASPPSNTYRLKKLALRYRSLLATLLAFALVLVAATVVSVRQAVRATQAETLAMVSRDRAVRSEAEAVASRDEARRSEEAAKQERDRAIAAEQRTQVERDRALNERQRADLQAATTKAVSDFLQNDLLRLANTGDQADRGSKTPTRDIKIRDALDRAAAKIGTRFQNQPEVEAEIRNTIGVTYHNLDLLPQAKIQLEAAYRLRRDKLGPLHPATLDTLDGVANVLRGNGSYAEAARLFTETVEGRRRALGPEHRDTLRSMHGLALTLRSQGKTQEAIAQHEKVFELRNRVFGEEDADTMRSLNDLAVANIYDGKSEKGLELAERAHRLRARVLGPEHPDTVVSLQAYGMGLFETGQGEKALQTLLRVRELNEKLRGPEHSITLNSTGAIGNAYVTLRRFDDAAKYFALAADGFTRLYGEKNPSAMNWRGTLGATLIDAGKYDEAIVALRSLLPISIEVRGPDHGETQQLSYSLARGLLAAGHLDEALALASKALEVRIKQRGPGHFTSALFAEIVAQALSRKGNLKEAEALYRRTIDARRAAKGDVSGLEAGLATVLLWQRRYAEAAELAQSALPKDLRWNTLYRRAIFGAALAGEQKFGEAETALLAVYEAMEPQRGRVVATEHHKLEAVRQWIFGLYQAQGKTELAAKWAARR